MDDIIVLWDRQTIRYIECGCVSALILTYYQPFDRLRTVLSLHTAHEVLIYHKGKPVDDPVTVTLGFKDIYSINEFTAG